MRNNPKKWMKNNYFTWPVEQLNNASQNKKSIKSWVTKIIKENKRKHNHC